VVASHVHDALGQVRRLRRLVLEKRGFRGYSGIARLSGGICVIAAAIFLSFSTSLTVHLAGWAVVAVVAALVNYGAMGYWFLYDPAVGRRSAQIMPATDALAPLAVGGILTLALLRQDLPNLLFGVWAALYGVAHVAHRHSLPKANYMLGLGYMVCGAVLLLTAPEFVNPRPMAAVFGIGEIAGGLIFLNMERGE